MLRRDLAPLAAALLLCACALLDRPAALSLIHISEPTRPY